MTSLDLPLGSGFAAGKADAYMRILNWEATMTRRRQVSRLVRYRRNWEYYTGEHLDPDQTVQPLEINYLRATVEAHASYLWGQWEPRGSIVTWSLRPRTSKGDKETMQTILDWIEGLFVGHEEIFYSGGTNQSIFGDCILRPRWNPLLETVTPESILPEYFHARWSAHDIADLREVVIAYPIERKEALENFGTDGNIQYTPENINVLRGFAIYWEYWTRDKFEIYIDNHKIHEEMNPTAYRANGDIIPGIIPFVHIPNVRSGGEFYGQSDIEAVLRIQDELNLKIADVGDIISYAAHPIILLRKYFGRASALPVGPDAVWDLGREGEAEYLAMKGDLPVDIDKYVDRMLAMFQDLSYMPAAAFGRSETAQANALAMAMEMMPVTQRVNWKRLHWKQGLVKYVEYAARICDANGALPFKLRDLYRYIFEPQFAPVLPKDRASSVLENVQLKVNGLRTIQRALEDLGERDAAQQAEAIISELEMMVKKGIIKNQAQQTVGGKNGSGEGGSPDTGTLARDR